jgi:hypothetical protein
LVLVPLELLEPLEPPELPELGGVDEPPAAPGVEELPEPVVPDAPPAALPLPDALPDASGLGLEPEVPEGGVLGVLDPALGVALSLDPAGGVVPEVDPEPVPLVEPLAAGVEDDDSSPAFLQPVAATLSNAARNSTFDT